MSIPVVLLPGLPIAAPGKGLRAYLQYRAEIAALGGRRVASSIDYSVWAAEARSIEQLADLCAMQIRSKHSGPVRIEGHSTGGAIALALAIRHPELVANLTLISAAARLGFKGRRRQKRVANALASGHVRAAAATMAFGTTTKMSERVALSILAWLSPGFVLGKKPGEIQPLLALEEHFDVTGQLHRIGVPTLLVGGTRDGFYPTHLFRMTAEEIPGANLVLLDGKGHLAPWQRPVRRLWRWY